MHNLHANMSLLRWSKRILKTLLPAASAENQRSYNIIGVVPECQNIHNLFMNMCKTAKLCYLVGSKMSNNTRPGGRKWCLGKLPFKTYKPAK